MRVRGTYSDEEMRSSSIQGPSLLIVDKEKRIDVQYHIAGRVIVFNQEFYSYVHSSFG